MSEYWQASYSNEDFEVLEELVKYQGHFTAVEQKIKFKMFAGGWSAEINRAKIIRRAAVTVLLYHPEEDAVLMVEQFRPGAIGHADLASPWLLEPVSGLIELGDTVEETAKREVEEEAGCVVFDLMPIGKYLVSPGISNEMVYVLCGRINSYNLTKFHGLASESEDIKVHVLPVEQVFSLLETNKLIAASSIIVMQWLKLNISNLRQKWGYS